ncbi:hypothetical protein [Marinobacter pelagius]|uniref:hypothetical protein n=1 Tax=Marinobacter pelagius TaxID=379482 RepID=UPI003CCB8166
MVRQEVPAQYLEPTPIPAPQSQRIDHCPIWGEALKAAITQCNADKSDAREWQSKGESK